MTAEIPGLDDWDYEEERRLAELEAASLLAQACFRPRVLPVREPQEPREPDQEEKPVKAEQWVAAGGIVVALILAALLWRAQRRG